MAATKEPKKGRKLVDVAEIGSKGGKARAASLSVGELSDSGRNAANARWEKWRADRGLPPKAAAKKGVKKAGKKAK